MFFADFNVLIFSKILLKFTIFFEIFEYFRSLLTLTIITGQQNFF